MAQFPGIDQPCPLSAAEQARIDGHCARCGKHVHRLDVMDEAARRQLLDTADGSLCVSYRRRPVISALLLLGAAAVQPVAASDGPTCSRASASPTTQTCPSGKSSSETDPLQGDAGKAQSPLINAVESDLILTGEALDTLPTDPEVTVFVGGVSTPQSAQWIDERDLPDLPVRRESER